jgi:hypothetical protein
MPTNVPGITFGATGFSAPSQTAILAGVQADINAAFGGNLNFGPYTPQGQLATSWTAIIGDCYDQIIALFNGMDPALANGRQQDGIGRIYFLSRLPATATVATCVCAGATGTTIPVSALAQDQNGNVYAATQSGTIGSSGSVSLTFACQVTGSIACPAGFIDQIYQAIPGWDTVINPNAGVIGSLVETRYAFEARREQSVALNAQGSCPSVLGALYSVPGVLDAYVTENVTASISGASFVGSITGTTLSVTQLLSGSIGVGMMLTGTSGALPVGGTQPLVGTTITALGSGTGSVGTYSIASAYSQTLASGTYLAAVGGVRLNPNSLYAAAYGGSASVVAQAIWAKKSPGCNYNGNTTVTVQDTSPGYSGPNYPSYAVTFETPPTMALIFSVTMANNGLQPANAVSLVQQAILQSFAGQDSFNTPRARLGSTIYAYRYAANIQALGVWADVLSIQIGVSPASAALSLTNVPINLEPTLTVGNISVAFQ